MRFDEKVILCGVGRSLIPFLLLYYFFFHLNCSGCFRWFRLHIHKCDEIEMIHLKKTKIPWHVVSYHLCIFVFVSFFAFGVWRSSFTTGARHSAKEQFNWDRKFLFGRLIYSRVVERHWNGTILWQAIRVTNVIFSAELIRTFVWLGTTMRICRMRWIVDEIDHYMKLWLCWSKMYPWTDGTCLRVIVNEVLLFIWLVSRSLCQIKTQFNFICKQWGTQSNRLLALIKLQCQVHLEQHSLRRRFFLPEMSRVPRNECTRKKNVEW